MRAGKTILVVVHRYPIRGLVALLPAAF